MVFNVEKNVMRKTVDNFLKFKVVYQYIFVFAVSYVLITSKDKNKYYFKELEQLDILETSKVQDNLFENFSSILLKPRPIDAMYE